MTDRRRAPAASPMHMHSIPSAAGAMSRLVCAQLREANIPLSPLLAKAGLTVEEIDDDSARLKASSQIKFVAVAATALQDDLLGVHVSLDFDLRRTGLYYYVLASSENIGDALQRAERYGRIVNEGAALSCNTAGDVAIRIAYVGVDRRLDRHQIEFWLVSFVRLFRQLVDRRLVPSRVRLAHHRAHTPPELRALLGCEIEFDAEVDEIVFPAPVRQMPIGSADHHLNELLIKYCEEALAHRGSGHSALRTNVEKAIAMLLPHGKAQAAEVARRLGMSPRTLTRRLATEGLTFSGILEEQRIDLARHYLRESRLPISQIGWLLGYRDLSAFTHAHKRWTGATPKQSRSSQPSAQQKNTSQHRGRSQAKGERR